MPDPRLGMDQDCYYVFSEGKAGKVKRIRANGKARLAACTSRWFETMGIKLRHTIGLDNIMWESDYPHVTSTYPRSWEFVERTLAGVAQEERKKILYGNAVRLYKLT